MFNNLKRIKGLVVAGALSLGLMLLTSAVMAEEAVDEEENLGEVLVTTSTKTERKKDEVPVNVDVITQEELQSANARTAQEALESLPGVAVNGDGGVRLQGMEGRQTLILIDGQKYYGGHDGVDLAQIPVEEIEQIEVVKGPCSSLYGSDAMGGVINIITKKRSKAPGGSFSLMGGSRDTQAYNAGFDFESGKFGGKVNLSYQTAGQAANETDGYTEKAFNLNLGYDLTPQAKLEFSPYFSQRYQDYDFRTHEREGVNLNWKYQPDEFSRWYVRGAHLTYKQWTDNRKTDTVTGSSEVEAGYSRLMGTQHLLTAGMQYHLEDIEDRGKKYQADQTINSFFIQDEMDFMPVQVILGARVDHHELWGDEVNPNLSLAYQFNERGRIRGTVGKAFQAPALSKVYADNWTMGRYIVHANPDLKPEESVGYQLGLDYRLSERVSLTTNLFRNDISDLIGYWTQTVSGQKHMYWYNIGKAMTTGAEFGLEARLNEKIKGNLGYTYLKTENVETGYELVERPVNTVTAKLDWQAPHRIRVQLTGVYTDKRYADAANTEKLEEYTTVNLNLEKQLNDKYAIYLKGENLLNVSDIDDAYQLDGAEYYLGVKARF
jgi:outer membrane receptor for ferrienterochelin and colicins